MDDDPQFISIYWVISPLLIANQPSTIIYRLYIYIYISPYFCWLKILILMYIPPVFSKVPPLWFDGQNLLLRILKPVFLSNQRAVHIHCFQGKIILLRKSFISLVSPKWVLTPAINHLGPWGHRPSTNS